MKQSVAHLTYEKELLNKFCMRHHIRRLSLYGSVLRGDFGRSSDVDVLVEFESGHVPGFFKLFEMEEELTAIFGGRKADIRTLQDLSRYFREDIISSMSVRYEA